MTPTPADLLPLMPGGVPCTGVEPIAGDGSVRRFFRIEIFLLQVIAVPTTKVAVRACRLREDLKFS